MLITRRKLLLIITFILLVIAIPLTVLLLQGNLDPRKKADSEGASFSFDPSSGTIVRGAEVEIKILLNTNGKSIVGSDSVISFDNTVFSVVDQRRDIGGVQTQPGSFFDKPLILANKVEGNKIYLSINSFTPFKGAGVFGTIKLQAKKNGTATLKFVEGETKITEQGSAQNILTAMRSATFNVEGANGTKEEGTPSASLSADLNKDSKVDEQDLHLFSKVMGTKTTNSPADLNKDGQVDQTDFKIFEGLFKSKR